MMVAVGVLHMTKRGGTAIYSSAHEIWKEKKGNWWVWDGIIRNLASAIPAILRELLRQVGGALLECINGIQCTGKMSEVVGCWARRWFSIRR